MPPKRKRHLTARRKYERRRRKEELRTWKTKKIQPFNGIDQLESDKFLAESLSDLFFLSDADCPAADINDELTDSDGFTANEFYVVLDRVYMYRPEGNLDELVSNVNERLFSKFREICRQDIHDSDFVYLHSSRDVKYIQVYEGDEYSVMPRVMSCVTVTTNFDLKLYVHDREVPFNHAIWGVIGRSCFTTDALKRLLSEFRKYDICKGNRDKDLQEILPGLPTEANVNVAGNTYSGYRESHYIGSTIRSVKCNLIIRQRGDRCHHCQVYRKTLLKTLHRKKNAPHRKESLEKQLLELRREIKQKISQNGVALSGSEHTDTTGVMDANGCEVNESYQDETCVSGSKVTLISKSAAITPIIEKHPEETPNSCDVCGKAFKNRQKLATHLRKHTVEKTSPCTVKKTYSCEVCGNTFNQRKFFIRHMSIHKNEKSHSCEVCGKTFSQLRYLILHMRAHKNEKAHSCEVCGNTFTQRKIFIIHMRAHKNEKAHSCKVCGKRFGHISRVAEHMRVHTGEKPYSCRFCEKAFSTRSILNSHLRIHTGEKPHVCEKCGKAFKRKEVLTSHLRMHNGEKPFSCSICGVVFGYSSNLMRHMKKHTGEMAFTCEVCGKAFYNNETLTQHVRLHTGEKPYICKTCGKAFSHRTSFSIHMRSHTEGKRPSCEVCGKTFSSRSSLRNHKGIHNGKYPCEVCGKTFSHSTYLKIHKRVHTGEKPYICKTCGKTFRQVGTLTDHKRIHTGEKPYSCEVCGKAFSQGTNLKRHINTMHTREKT